MKDFDTIYIQAVDDIEIKETMKEYVCDERQAEEILRLRYK